MHRPTTRSSARAPAHPLSPPPNPDALPHPLTIFTSRRERSAVIKALKRYDPDRRAALCKALNIKPDDSPR